MKCAINRQSPIANRQSPIASSITFSICLFVLGTAIACGQDIDSFSNDPQKSAKEEPSRIVSTPKLVSLRKIGDSPTLVGEIDLGHIQSGQPVEVAFELRNTGAKLLQVRAVSSSCTCTKVVLPQLDLAEGETSKEVGQISIKPPKSRGQAVLATVHLLESANLPAVAALTVKAYVERPYSLSSSYVTVGLPKESVAFIPIDVDPTLDLNEIKTAVKPSIATCVIERSSTNSAARIRISGNREELIAAKRVIVDLSYQNEKTNWDLRDSLTIELFDSLACRVVPSIPKIVNDRVSFMLFRKEPFDAQKLKCLPKNCEFQGTFANKSDKIVTVEGQVLHALDDPRLEISDGSFSITVPLASL